MIVNFDGRTTLIFAAEYGHTVTVQALLHADANCKLETTAGATALSLAIYRNHQEVIDLLRQHIADTEKSSKGFFSNWFG